MQFTVMLLMDKTLQIHKHVSCILTIKHEGTKCAENETEDGNYVLIRNTV